MKKALNIDDERNYLVVDERLILFQMMQHIMQIKLNPYRKLCYKCHGQEKQKGI